MTEGAETMRDLRDPQQLGAALLRRTLRVDAARHAGVATDTVTMSQAYDFGAPRGLVPAPDFDDTSSPMCGLPKEEK